MIRLKFLDEFRGIFALMVVFYHTLSLGITPQFIVNSSLIDQSYIFVDFFFVMSGYIISKIYQEITDFHHFLKFYRKRVLRLYPLVFISVVVLIVMIYTSNFIGVTIPESLKIRFYSPLEWLETLLLMNSNTLFGSGEGVNSPTWSISAEMVSYFVYGLMILVFTSKRTRIGLSLVFVIVPLVYLIFIVNDPFPEGDFGWLRGLIGFNMGVLSIQLKRKSAHNVSRFLLVLILLIFIGLEIYQFQLGFLAYAVFFIFAVSLLLRDENKRSTLSLIFGKRIQFLGDISFTLYIFHKLVIMTLYPIVEKLDFPQEITYGMLILSVVYVSFLLNKWLEIPVQSYLRSNFVD
jgi:peptidoglycan/LPS O-acetylase OafA/YrhL